MLYGRIDYFRTSTLSKMLTLKNKALKFAKKAPDRQMIEALEPEITELKTELAKRRKAGN